MNVFIQDKNVSFKIWKMLRRILYKTRIVFFGNETQLSGNDLKAVAFRFQSMYALHFFPGDMLKLIDDKDLIENMAKASGSLCMCMDFMMSQLLAFKNFSRVDSDIIRAFGEVSVRYLDEFRVFRLMTRQITIADIMKTIKSICLSEEVLMPDYYRDVAIQHQSLIQKLRNDYSRLSTPDEMRAFEEFIKSITKSQFLLRDIDLTYQICRNVSFTNTDLMNKRRLYIEANGPGSLDQFEQRWQMIHTSKMFDEMQSELNMEFVNKLCELKAKTNAATQNKPTEEECKTEKSNWCKQLEIALPGIPVSDHRKNIMWHDFKRDISKAYFIINRIRMNIDVDLSVAVDKIPKPPSCTYAKLGVDVVYKSSTSIHTPQVQGFLAKAVLKLIDFDYKSTELLVTYPNKITVLDLGNDFAQFRNCKLVWHMHHGLQSMTIVKTHFSSYMIFAESFSPYTNTHISAANNTFRFTIEKRKKEDDPVRNSSGIAIVELKLCAACGKAAEQKCAHCWRTSKIPIRYCSRDCVVKDRPRHSLVCGRDFSDVWKPV